MKITSVSNNNNTSKQNKPTFGVYFFKTPELVSFFDAIKIEKAKLVSDVLIKSKEEIQAIKAFDKDLTVSFFDVQVSESGKVIQFLTKAINHIMDPIGNSVGKISIEDTPESIASEIIRTFKAANADYINKKSFGPSEAEMLAEQMTKEING